MQQVTLKDVGGLVDIGLRVQKVVLKGKVTYNVFVDGRLRWCGLSMAGLLDAVEQVAEGAEVDG